MELILSQSIAASPSRCRRHGGFHRRSAEGKRRNPLVRRGKDGSLGSCGKRHGAQRRRTPPGGGAGLSDGWRTTQLPDGSWWSATRDGVPEDKTRDSNVSSYIAVGVYHHFLITGDIGFLKRLWPTLEAGIDYAVGLQADTGEIHWARNSEGIVDRMALLTGSSSVYMSLKCAIAIAALLGKRRTDWEVGLGEARRGDPLSSRTCST